MSKRTLDLKVAIIITVTKERAILCIYHYNDSHNCADLDDIGVDATQILGRIVS